MSSGNERDDYIWQLRAEGWTVVEIAAEVGLSRSQVYRVLERIGDPARGDVREDDDDDADPWDDDEDEGQLALVADEDEEVYPPPPPWTFVGYEGDEERWITAAGKPVSSLDRYRWLVYQRNEYDDRAGAKRVEADMDRQIEAYEARQAHGGRATAWER